MKKKRPIKTQGIIKLIKDNLKTIAAVFYIALMNAAAMVNAVRQIAAKKQHRQVWVIGYTCLLFIVVLSVLLMDYAAIEI